VRSTDVQWERWGNRDPYYGVLSDERYRRGRLTDHELGRFFESGERHVEQLLRTIRERLDPRFAPSSILDYGCGVGRTLIPLAGHAGLVVGMDVSDSMLAEARRNCDGRSLAHITLVRADDELSALSGTFDLIHSLLVFQHIEVQRGERIATALVRRLAPGGIGALQFLVATGRSWWRRALGRARDRVPGLHALANLAKGRSPDEPLAQMNVYDLSRLLQNLRRQGINQVVCEGDEQDGNLSVMLLFQKRLDAAKLTEPADANGALHLEAKNSAVRAERRSHLASAKFLGPRGAAGLACHYI
jgi:SAM-dependent methyltransferase